ncbi:MAG: hypothetical protein KF760_25010 [Candidatus Eremiobacteraeota bacterium]|nr:hypothetical protein [Candidatus Eremiobacteraeota bacterium]MCW5870885.1 hypothetical protein [Candidatus Eremiobacteraeota bacterium]
MRKTRRAIMLISVLLISMLTLMFATAAISLAPSGLARSAADSSLAAADRATRSGLDWARSRISQDPRWKATNVQTFNAPGLYVTEGQGQVTGWVAENSTWNRFRIRFNYQDGTASTDPASDEMNDPTTTWSDFPYCSCNNLVGGSSRPLPLAQGMLGAYTSSGPWATSQLTIPSNTLVLSIEGGSGRSVAMSGGQPSAFVGSYHKRIAQAVLHLGNNQPITDAAVMAAGNLFVTSNAPALLNAPAGQTARMRTKADLNIDGGITSTIGELMHGGSQSVSGPVTGVTVKSEDTTGLYQIPADKVRNPVSPIGLQAGTYLVNASGQLMYVNMDYKDYVMASPQPTGTAVALPSGMSITTNPGSPKFTVTLSKDLQINPSGSITGFALVPEGGAPQSAGYGGVPAAANPLPALTASGIMNAYFSSPYSSKLPLDADSLAAWKTILDNAPASTVSSTSASASSIGIGSVPSSAVTYTRYTVGGGSVWLPNGIPASPAKGYIWKESSSSLPGALSSAAVADFTALQTATAAAATPTGPAPAAPPSTALRPKDLELQLQGGANGVMVANDGDITIGAQIASNGSALVSKGDIRLIGTSTDFNSSSGTQLGLNLYAQGNILIDAYDLDSTSGGSFHSVKLQGVVYAWKDITVLAADGSGTSVGPFTLKGSMVAYGGDPAGPSTTGAGNVTVTAGSVDITYDPSYVAALAPAGPFSMEILSWHQF